MPSRLQLDIVVTASDASNVICRKQPMAMSGAEADRSFPRDEPAGQGRITHLREQPFCSFREAANDAEDGFLAASDHLSVQALERAAAVEGGYGPLYYRLALALRSVERVREAQGFLDLHAALGPVRRPPFADPYLRQVEELRTGSYLHHLNRGMRMEAAGRFGEAVAEYLRAIEAEPGEPHAMVNLISAYGALGRNDEAEAAYADACALNPELEEAHYNYGLVLGRRQDYTGAGAAYRRALSINPYSSDDRVNLGDALENLSQGDTAEEQYRQVLEQLPGHRLANFRLGLLLHRRGEMERALEHFRAAVLERRATSPCGTSRLTCSPC